jgi:hypothetical protein
MSTLRIAAVCAALLLTSACANHFDEAYSTMNIGKVEPIAIND